MSSQKDTKTNLLSTPETPARVIVLRPDTPVSPSHKPCIFLAGGMSGPNGGWRANVIDRLGKMGYKGCVYDPVLPNHSGIYTETCMKWEGQAIHAADAVAFYFPKGAESLCMIAIMELGRRLGLKESGVSLQTIMVGWDDEYECLKAIRHGLMVPGCSVDMATDLDGLQVLVERWASSLLDAKTTTVSAAGVCDGKQI